MYMYIHAHFEIKCRTLRDKPKQFAVINIVHHIQYSTENIKTNTKRERESSFTRLKKPNNNLAQSGRAMTTLLLN